MKKIITFLLIFSTSYAVRLLGQAACPANNTCATAYTLTPSSSCTTTSFNIASCTDENATGDCTNGGGADNTIWFQFTAIATTATVTVVGGSGSDMVVGAIVTCGSATTPTGGGCIDASGDGGTETLNLTGLTIGTTYRIGVHEYYADATGTGTICVQQSLPITNDNCSGAITLTPSSSGTCTGTAGTTTGATQSQAGCIGTADDDVWYQFTATNTSHTIQVANTGGNTDIVTQVFTGACGSLTQFGSSCSDNDAGQTLTGLTIGTTYRVRIYTYSSGVTSQFTICVSEPAAGEDCANPIVISAATSYCGNLCNSGCQTATDIQPGNISLAFCGFADDLFYLQFVASATSASFNITAGTPSNIQIDMMQVTGGCTGTWSHAGTTPCLNGPASIPSPVTFAGLTIGNTYYLVIDNVSGSSTSWCFSPVTGVLVCDITALTATPSACASNLYNVSGSMTLANPPATGTMAIQIDGVTCQTISAPFTSTQSYSCTGLSADGASHTITAVFSANAGCTENVSYTAPAACVGGCSANNGTWN